MYLKVIEWMSYTILHKRTTYLQHVAMDKDLSFKYAVATYFMQARLWLSKLGVDISIGWA